MSRATRKPFLTTRFLPFTLSGSIFARAACVALPGFLFAGAMQAQFSSSLQGTVTDPSGAVIGNAVVTLTQTDTNTKRSATTSGSGTHAFGSLAPGNYMVEVTA